MKDHVPLRRPERTLGITQGLSIVVLICMSMLAVLMVAYLTPRPPESEETSEILIVRYLIVVCVIPVIAVYCDIGRFAAPSSMSCCICIFVLHVLATKFGAWLVPASMVPVVDWIPREGFPEPIRVVLGRDQADQTSMSGSWMMLALLKVAIHVSIRYCYLLGGILCGAFWKYETGFDQIFIATVSGLYVGSFDWEKMAIGKCGMMDAALYIAVWTCTGMLVGTMHACISTGEIPRRWYWYCIMLMVPFVSCVQLMIFRVLFDHLVCMVVCGVYFVIMLVGNSR